MDRKNGNDAFITPGHLVAQRVSRLRDKLQSNGVDGALVMSPANIRYLSGFTSEDAFVLITADRAILFTDFRYITQAKIETGGKGDFSYEIQRIDNNFYDLFAGIAESEGLGKIYIEADFITFSQYTSLSKVLPSVQFCEIGSLIQDLRAVKDEHEISLIKQAISIADKAFTKILEVVKPGMTEKEICDELEYLLNKFGAYGTSFDTIAVSGSRTAMPHGQPSTRVVQENDIITLDFGAKFCGYCSDMTRTFFVGKPDDELLKIYHIVNEARARAIEAARGGMAGKDIDDVARNFIAEKGYGDFFGHGLGHSLGLEIHEDPRLSPRFSGPVPVGAVTTVEPGIYIENLGGVRIEDVVLMTEDGCELLTGSARELICI